LAAERSGQILEQAKWLAFGAQQDVAGQERGTRGRAARLDFEHRKAEYLCGATSGHGHFHGIERYAEPAIVRVTISTRASEKISDGVAGNRKGQAAGDHGVNSDHAAAGVSERTARISGSET